MELLELTGIDAAVVLLPVRREAVGRRPPLAFIERVLVKCLRYGMPFVVGEDFHFGRNREGNVALLRGIGPDLRVRC